MKKKLAQFGAAVDARAQNELLFAWLSDDEQRAQLYQELRAHRPNNFPVLRFKSLLQSRDGGEWSMEDVYLVSRQDQVEAALKHYSVEPYSKLGSGGRFMLGLDDEGTHAHDRQRAVATRGMDYSSKEIEDCAIAAFERAAIRLLQRHVFDLSDLAEQAALNFVKLLFGLRDESHGRLQPLMSGAYRGLVFAIVGRHFVPAADAQLGSELSARAKELKERLEEEIGLAAQATGEAPFRKGAPKEPVIKKLWGDPGGFDVEMRKVIVTGLIAGTIGNVRVAVPIAIHDFFTRKDGQGRPLIDEARRAAREDGSRLDSLITEALLRNPPTPFLARRSRPLPTGESPLVFTDEEGADKPIPDGAHILLAMGADPKRSLLFGGTYPEFMHQCVGQHLAWPLIYQVVRHVLLLPGLAQKIQSDIRDRDDDEPSDPSEKIEFEVGEPAQLKKIWGAMARPYKLRYQRDRRLNQQPLFVVLPIKEPVQENARKLEVLTQAGAHIVEQALAESGIVHFAWFKIVEFKNRTCLALSTVYDGDFDAYVEHFASKVPLFDEQFQFLDVKQPFPITQHPKEFVEIIRNYNQAPLAKYFFSAYPLVSVAEVKNSTGAGMTAASEKAKKAPTSLPTDDLPQVQRLALTGYDFNHAVHVVLRIKHAIGKPGVTGQEWDANKQLEAAERARAAAAKAREFLAELLQREDLTFGDRAPGEGAINVGFTYRGLEALELSESYLKELEVKAPAFRQGAPARAARHLGDSGESAAERWDGVFKWDNAHVLISSHAVSAGRAMEIARELASLPGARDGFDGWNESDWLKAAHLSTDSRKRTVHFGFRDNIARPVIAGASSKEDRKPRHSAGELLLGHTNDEDFNRWGDDRTDEKVARFFRNGSFCVLRKIEQHEKLLNDFLDAQAYKLLKARTAGLPQAEAEALLTSFQVYLKAKLCGRWPNGARMKPGQDSEPDEPNWEDLQADAEFNFKDDPDGFGCPFGAHIRRTSPRGDKVLPLRRRPLFRRGMPYGQRYGEGSPTEQRGLIGLFFCSSIEDQFEHVMSEWVEKMPMGPPSRGNAKDPLVGNNEDVEWTFHIPVRGAQASAWTASSRS
jgi:deferrochelatase/peroxidase EfeB